MKSKLLIMFMWMSGISFGQITISYTDFSQAFGPGSTYHSYTTPIGGPTVSVFVGEASGTAQYWDFSNYTFDYIGKSVGINPSTAPFINEFPTSNFVLYEKGWMLGTDTIDLWNYKELQSDKLRLLGLSGDSSFTPFNPANTQAVVPLTYGSTWNVSSGSVTVDAFGTMKLPSGEYECLRVRWDNVGFQRTPGMVNAENARSLANTRSYIFYSKAVREVNVLGVQENQFSLTTVDVPSFSFSDREGNAGISEKEIPLLTQNFPNPFHSQTAIRYNIASRSTVKLSVYDFLGKEVAILVNEVQSPGDHEVTFDATGLQGGLYYYQLMAGDRSISMKMIISK
jgi:hypothetical protein